MRKINAEGLAHIRQWEGLRLKAYDDATGKPIMPGDPIIGTVTIGYGHVRTATPGTTISEAKAEELLRSDLSRFEAAVDRLVTVPLTDNQFAALVSLAFNIGEGAFGKSTLLRKLNAGDYDAVPSEMARWNKVKGAVIPGLANRRAAEIGLWAKGAYVTSAGPTTAEPQSPPAITKETLSWAATIVASLGATLSGSGPVQWAFGAVIVGAALIGGYLFIKHRVRPT